MSTTRIEWADKTWNPVTGCTKCSAGCTHCYAETMAQRLCAMGLPKYRKAFEPALHEDCLNEPLAWKNGLNVFVCSMSDLFHESVPFDYIDRVLDVIAATPQHRYQILTKRAERLHAYSARRDVPDNAWLGVTVESKSRRVRIDYLRNIPASVHFLSCEPLLEDLGILDLQGIEWVIVGGESGPQARPMKEEWVLRIRAQAMAQGCAFFFKQWGTWGRDGVKRSKRANGKILAGQVVQEVPSRFHKLF